MNRNMKRYTNIMLNNYILINIEKSYAISTIYINNIYYHIYKKTSFYFSFLLQLLFFNRFFSIKTSKLLLFCLL